MSGEGGGGGVKSSLTFILSIFSKEVSNNSVKSGWANPKEILSSICREQRGRRTDCKCAGYSALPPPNMTKNRISYGTAQISK